MHTANNVHSLCTCSACKVHHSTPDSHTKSCASFNMLASFNQIYQACTSYRNKNAKFYDSTPHSSFVARGEGDGRGEANFMVLHNLTIAPLQLYLVKCSVETSQYIIICQCSCHSANIGFPQDVGLLQ